VGVYNIGGEFERFDEELFLFPINIRVRGEGGGPTSKRKNIKKEWRENSKEKS